VTAAPFSPGAPIVWRPLAMTLLLHAALLYALTVNWTGRETVTIEPPQVPKYVRARLVDAEALRPKPEPATGPEPAARETAVRPQPAGRPEPAAARPRPAAEPKPAEAEPEPEPVAEAEPEHPTAEELAAAARAELSRALEVEDQSLRQADDARITAGYIALIGGIVEDNWSRPPSARNGMEAELTIQLIPTGEVVSVAVARGSGLPAFDRSAVMAVRKAERFPELRELPPRLFEKNFRRLRLKFKPEDLRY